MPQTLRQKITCDITIKTAAWHALDFDITRQTQKVIRTSFAMLPVLPALKRIKKIELGVILTSDSAIKKINKDFRGFDKPTNVLSFAQLDDPYVMFFEPFFLGEIILSYQTLKKESQAQDKRFLDHYTHLLIHGLLHLMQYDHINSKDALKMEKKEIEILKKLKIANPYL
jgi:probable rRNA maturation factor